MTKTEKAIIDSVKEKCKKFNSVFLSKLTIMYCIKKHTSHNTQTVLNLMYEHRLIRYDRDTYKYRLARGLLDGYVARDEKNYKELSIYLDYHADEILKKLTTVLAYQDRIEIADFFNKYYIDVDLVKNVDKCTSRDLFPNIKPEDVDLQYVRVWLYKLYLTCYKFSSAYKQLPQAYKEVAATMTDKIVKKDGYYVLFNIITSTYVIKRQTCENHLTLEHVRYFDNIEDAEKFKKMLDDNCNNDNNQYNGNDYLIWYYQAPTILKVNELKPARVAMACTHLLPIELEEEKVRCCNCGAFIDEDVSKICPECGTCICNFYYDDTDDYDDYDDYYVDEAGNYYDSYGEYREVFDSSFGGIPEENW